MREGDIVARFGGEEFCVLAADIDLASATRLFSELCIEMEKTEIFIDNEIEKLTVTISIGVCTDSLDNLDQMVKDSDELLYKAKTTGRNRVVFSAE